MMGVVRMHKKRLHFLLSLHSAACVVTGNVSMEKTQNP